MAQAAGLSPQLVQGIAGHSARVGAAQDMAVHGIDLAGIIPTVSPLLIPVTSHNILLLTSLPNSIPYRQDNVRRRKDEPRVGTAARGSLERLSRLPRRLHADGGASGRVRQALSTRVGDRGQRAPRAPLP